jgi:DNA modification methylase
VEINKLILGDNLEILKTIESESVDLIYLDPPFFSNRNYEVIWGDNGKYAALKTDFRAE